MHWHTERHICMTCMNFPYRKTTAVAKAGGLMKAENEHPSPQLIQAKVGLSFSYRITIIEKSSMLI